MEVAPCSWAKAKVKFDNREVRFAGETLCPGADDAFNKIKVYNSKALITEGRLEMN